MLKSLVCLENGVNMWVNATVMRPLFLINLQMFAMVQTAVAKYPAYGSIRFWFGDSC